jgi:hypothetical protein
MGRLTETELYSTTDAMAWAREFVATVQEHPSIPYDEGTMVGWFANAMEAGRLAKSKHTHPTWEEHEEARKAGKLFDPCGPDCPKPPA